MTTTNRLRSLHDEVTIDLYITDCASCGVIFGMPRSLETRRREDHGSFYCPNGHSMVFRGKTEAEKLEEQLAIAKRNHQWTRESLDAARQLAYTESRRAAAFKGHLTRLRNRVRAGVCPEAGCKRSFENVADHVRTCHPELAHVLDPE